jgi:hypothetical protein
MDDRQRLEAIVSVINKYLPPDGIPINDAMSEIISLVDPLPAPQPAQEPVKWAMPQGWWIVESTPDALNMWPTSKDILLDKTLAQPAQEPVAHFGSAYVNENGVHITTVLGPVAIPQDAKLYTAPPQRSWVELTDEEIDKTYWRREPFRRPTQFEFARDIEQLLKEKNT